MNDYKKEIEEIIIRAIPSETCPVKNSNAMYRRDKAIKKLVVLFEELIKSHEQPTNGHSGRRVSDAY
jgi:hypothetical protein